MKKMMAGLLAGLSLAVSLFPAWANGQSLKDVIAVPFREKAEKITLFDKIPTNNGDLLNVEVVLSFQVGPSQRQKYSSYQSVLQRKGKYTLAYSDVADIGPRSQYFSEAMARKIALSRYQYQVRKNRQAEILKRLGSPNLSLPKEDIWALKQLKFNVPSTVKELKH